MEEKLAIAQEYYLGWIVSDRVKAPQLLLSAGGGSGIEERGEGVQSLTLSVLHAPDPQALSDMAKAVGAPPAMATLMARFCEVARRYEARSAEINPVALLKDGRCVALDCRLSLDDYAVFRHPELGIEIARELSQPPTALDRIAWEVEKDDYRGTFYFLETPSRGDAPLVGFHGCGGGGAMASLDALGRAGLRAANFCDTSGSPAASKVYRAARLILSQTGIAGYFLSGSGVASQEQFHLARAVVKAFRDAPLGVPAVLRLGGNGENQAVEIVQRYAAEAKVPIEAYTKDRSADFCAARLRELIAARRDYRFATRTGTIRFDHALCETCASKACIDACGPRILEISQGLPGLAIAAEEAERGKCTECLACEWACGYLGQAGATIHLPIKGWNAWPS